MLNLQAIGERIYAIRTRRGWSQTQLGMRLQSAKTPAWVSLVETGGVPNLSVAMLAELADALEVPIASLLAERSEAQLDVTLIPGWDDLPAEEQEEVKAFIKVRSRLIRESQSLPDLRSERQQRRVADEEAGDYGGEGARGGHS